MKRNLFHAALAAVFALCCMPSFSQTIPDPATPDATYKFAEKDGQDHGEQHRRRHEKGEPPLWIEELFYQVRAEAYRGDGAADRVDHGQRLVEFFHGILTSSEAGERGNTAPGRRLARVRELHMIILS